MQSWKHCIVNSIVELDVNTIYVNISMLLLIKTAMWCQLLEFFYTAFYQLHDPSSPNI